MQCHFCSNFYFARGSVAKYCDEICLSVCLSVCRRGYLQNHICAIFTMFLCMLPMSVARSSSGMLTIGCIAYRRERGDGSAQRGRSVIYDCLLLSVVCFSVFKEYVTGNNDAIQCKLKTFRFFDCFNQHLDTSQKLYKIQTQLDDCDLWNTNRKS